MHKKPTFDFALSQSVKSVFVVVSAAATSASEMVLHATQSAIECLAQRLNEALKHHQDLGFSIHFAHVQCQKFLRLQGAKRLRWFPMFAVSISKTDSFEKQPARAMFCSCALSAFSWAT